MPDVPMDEMVIDIYDNYTLKPGKIILGVGVDFVHGIGKITWCNIKLNDLIDADYDILRDDLWEATSLYMDKTPEDHIRILSGVQQKKYDAEIVKLRKENAKLRAENAELRLLPGGPEYLAAKERFEDWQKNAN